MPTFRAGVLAIALIALVTYFVFSGANPFSHRFELNAVFQTSSNLSTRSPVRIAGIEVGKVKEVKALSNGTSRVRMELDKRALPIHADAQLKIRPRLFLGGNFVVDLNAGSPSAPVLKDGATIPLTQTQAPVILDPFDQSLDNANLVVVAPAGAGKSFTVKLLALRQLVNGVDCIIIDPEDEYRPIAHAVDGQIIRLAASSGHQPGGPGFRPFVLGPQSVVLVYLFWGPQIFILPYRQGPPVVTFWP